MWPDRCSNKRPIDLQTDSLPTALYGPAQSFKDITKTLNWLEGEKYLKRNNIIKPFVKALLKLINTLVHKSKHLLIYSPTCVLHRVSPTVLNYPAHFEVAISHKTALSSLSHKYWKGSFVRLRWKECVKMPNTVSFEMTLEFTNQDSLSFSTVKVTVTREKMTQS